MTMRALHLMVLMTVVSAAQAVAQTAATGKDIRAALSGNTVVGSMLASGAYAEFYAADGSIRAADYAGKWRVQGDKMCFSYGTDPESCWAAAISGASVTWLGDSGAEGSGAIKSGNPGGW